MNNEMYEYEKTNCAAKLKTSSTVRCIFVFSAMSRRRVNFGGVVMICVGYTDVLLCYLWVRVSNLLRLREARLCMNINKGLKNGLIGPFIILSNGSAIVL
jgi:hypothetical protein